MTGTTAGTDGVLSANVVELSSVLFCTIGNVSCACVVVTALFGPVVMHSKHILSVLITSPGLALLPAPWQCARVVS